MESSEKEIKEKPEDRQLHKDSQASSNSNSTIAKYFNTRRCSFSRFEIPQHIPRRASINVHQADIPSLDAFQTPNIMKKMIFQSISVVNTKSIKSKNETVLEQLIEELKIGDKHLQKDVTLRRKNVGLEDINFLTSKQSFLRRRQKIETKEENKRDCIKIMNLLKMIPDFKKFMLLNSITDESIIRASDYIIYVHIKSGHYLFNEGDEPDGFYIILAGTIDITKRSNNLTKINLKLIDMVSNPTEANLKPEYVIPRNKKLTYLNSFRNFFTTASVQRFLQLEEKLLTLGPGSCFGDWGLIDGEKRQANAVSSSECHLVKISKAIYELHFKVKFINLLFRNA